MRDTEQEEQGVETYHSDKSDKVDMMMNPENLRSIRSRWRGQSKISGGGGHYH